MSGPVSWGVSILVGLAGAFLGWLIFTKGLGIGDDDIFDLGGIVGAIASRNVVPLLTEGLKRLEYRGYDSAGIAVVNRGIRRVRRVGRVAEMENAVIAEGLAGILGIAHTRWATHGGVTEPNAHPHVSGHEIAVVHNGIIENHEQQRARLKSLGYAVRGGHVQEPSLSPRTETSPDALASGPTALFRPGELGRMVEAQLALDYASRATASGRALALGPVEIVEVEARKPGKAAEAAFKTEANTAKAEADVSTALERIDTCAATTETAAAMS
jgi:hypothetical protein